MFRVICSKILVKYDNTRHFFLSGKCNVDYTEKGWFIQYIDRDPETIRKQELVKAKEKMDMDDSEREAKLIQQQIERAAKQEKNVIETEFTELKRENEEEKGTIATLNSHI